MEMCFLTVLETEEIKVPRALISPKASLLGFPFPNVSFLLCTCIPGVSPFSRRTLVILDWRHTV